MRGRYAGDAFAGGPASGGCRRQRAVHTCLAVTVAGDMISANGSGAPEAGGSDELNRRWTRRWSPTRSGGCLPNLRLFDARAITAGPPRKSAPICESLTALKSRVIRPGTSGRQEIGWSNAAFPGLGPSVLSPADKTATSTLCGTPPGRRHCPRSTGADSRHTWASVRHEGRVTERSGMRARCCWWTATRFPTRWVGSGARRSRWSVGAGRWPRGGHGGPRDRWPRRGGRRGGTAGHRQKPGGPRGRGGAAGRGVEVLTFCESHTRHISFGVVARLLRAGSGVADLDGEAARARVREQAPSRRLRTCCSSMTCWASRSPRCRCPPSTRMRGGAG